MSPPMTNINDAALDRRKRIVLGGWIERQQKLGRTELSADEIEAAKASIEEAFGLALPAPVAGDGYVMGKLIDALLWIENADPEIVSAAEEKFGFKLNALAAPSPAGDEK